MRSNKITLIDMPGELQENQYITNCSLEDAFNQFITCKQNENLRERTIDEHKIHFKYFSQYLYKHKQTIRGVNQISAMDLADYIAYMREKTVWSDHPTLKEVRSDSSLSPVTINTRLRTLRCQLNWWYDNKFISTDLAKAIKLLKVDRNPTTFKDNDVKRLLAIPEKEQKYSDLRNYVIMLLLADTGLRIHQLLSQRIEDINLLKRELYFPAETCKTRDAVTLSFSPQLKVWIDQLIKQNELLGISSGYLFVTADGKRFSENAFRKALHRYNKIANIKGVRVSPHTFRRYFATSFYELSGGDIYSLQDLLFHKNIGTTELYISKNTERVKRAHIRYSPINQLV